MARGKRLALSPDEDLMLGEILFAYIDAVQANPGLRFLFAAMDTMRDDTMDKPNTVRPASQYFARAYEMERNEKRARQRYEGRSSVENKRNRMQRNELLGMLVDKLHRQGKPLNDSRSGPGAYTLAAQEMKVEAPTAKRAHDAFRALFRPFDYSR